MHEWQLENAFELDGPRIWRLLNNGGKEFRLYALDSSGHFVGGAVDFVAGEMNQAFEGSQKKPFQLRARGWLRLAEVQSANDTEREREGKQRKADDLSPHGAQGND